MEITQRVSVLTRSAVVGMLGLLVSACATTYPENEAGYVEITAKYTDELPKRSMEIISIDLVSALMQLQEMSPFYTTVQVSKTTNPFGVAVIDALDKSGFGVQYVSNDQGRNYLNYQISRQITQSRSSTQYRISIDQISVTRRYKSYGSTVIPDSGIEVVGAKPTNVFVKSEIFRQQGATPSFPNGIIFYSANGDIQTSKLNLLSSVKSAPKIDSEETNSQELFKALLFAKAAIYTSDRMRETVENSRKLRESYKPIKQIVLLFQPGSMNLGAANKEGVRKFMSDFDKINDSFLITGCSHGVSMMYDGTESRSLERQLRVKEELMTSGIPLNNIKEEGCFSQEFGENLKPYSVKLTHKRILAGT